MLKTYAETNFIALNLPCSTLSAVNKKIKIKLANWSIYVDLDKYFDEILFNSLF